MSSACLSPLPHTLLFLSLCRKRPIECFHMTPRRPYWCPKPVLWELNSFLMQTLSFVPIDLHRCWSRECKRSIQSNLHKQPPLYNGHLFTNHLSTTATSLQQPPLYNGHLSTTVTSLQQPPLYNGHLSTMVTSLKRPPLYNGHLSTTATFLQR